MTFHKAVEVTQYCFNWCKEQNFIHQNNLEIKDLSIVAVALISLVLHSLLYNYHDFIVDKFKLDSDKLNKLYIATSDFSYILLTIFLIYQIVIK